MMGSEKKLASINNPNVVLNLSNSIIHEIEGLIKTIRKTLVAEITEENIARIASVIGRIIYDNIYVDI